MIATSDTPAAAELLKHRTLLVPHENSCPPRPACSCSVAFPTLVLIGLPVVSLLPQAGSCHWAPASALSALLYTAMRSHRLPAAASDRRLPDTLVQAELAQQAAEAALCCAMMSHR